jgi:hypothetical protein
VLCFSAPQVLCFGFLVEQQVWQEVEHFSGLAALVLVILLMIDKPFRIGERTSMQTEDQSVSDSEHGA